MPGKHVSLVCFTIFFIDCPEFLICLISLEGVGRLTLDTLVFVYTCTRIVSDQVERTAVWCHSHFSQRALIHFEQNKIVILYYREKKSF